MYYGSTAGFLQIVGTTSTNTNPTSACGYYNGMWGTCTNWGVNGNYSLYAGWREGANPRLNTGQTGTTNISMNTGYRYKDRMFCCNILVSNAGGTNNLGGFSSPFGGAVNASNTAVYAYKNMSMSNNQNFITTTGITDYGYVFLGYRLESSSGTFLTSTQTVSWYFNGTYGSKSFAYIKNLHMGYGVAGKPSDRKLKENIRLVGKSISGINIYTWTYKNQEIHGKGVFQGVMAQEVPHATIQHPDGYLMVDYSKVDVIFKKVYGSNMGN